MNQLLTITAAALLTASFSSITSANLMGDYNKNANNRNNAPSATSEVKGMASDTWITTQVKTKLISKGWTGVSVETTKGNIVLSGNVKNSNDISEVERLIKELELKDVTVDNQLKVGN